MEIILVFIIISLAAGRARGGNLKRLSDFQIRFWPVIIFSFLIQAALPWLKGNALSGYSFALIIISYLLLLAAVLGNERNPGFITAAAGIFLNFIVIVLNRGMPVNISGLDSAAVARLASANDGLHVIMGPETKLPWLADIISFPGPLGGLASIGDVLLGLGLFVLIQSKMLYAGKHRGNFGG